jgi:hypothetical protein
LKISSEQVVDAEILGARFRFCVADAVLLEFEGRLAENGCAIADLFVRYATQENYPILPLKRSGAYGAREAVQSEPMR